jgi:type II secretory ATPase GspE/PulE/Tfp pilus assembly ATPase PilB-like protein
VTQSLPLVHSTPALAKRLIKELHQREGSDLHLTPDDDRYFVSIRRHGVLEPLLTVSSKMGRELANHWKVLANLDLTLTHKPQDGSILNTKTGSLSYRVSTCPTLFGEKVVIRLHATSLSALTINELGMTSNQLSHYLRAIQNTSGLILASGATGSGKTNTLYAALNHLKKQSLNIISVEDPIEINLPGITQVNVSESFGFPQALRTLLRQDLDVMMIGEIRDPETAKIAISSAQTGHLVLASIHANDIHGALSRLQSLGVSIEEVLSQLLLVSSQQLVRIYRQGSDFSAEDRYQGRCGVFDIVACTAPIREQLLTSFKSNGLKDALNRYLKEERDHTDSILLRLIDNNQTDWTELQRVYGWEKVAILSAQKSSLAIC